ncbi:pentapeptide repeat-containing protein [Roseibium sp. HPY-6]|uniref:pentapeptide repeat-containing protein n=1 Tax=Roseibium sp. HPY-6 TaxID=3229852 RepID=UPI00338FE46F
MKRDKSPRPRKRAERLPSTAPPTPVAPMAVAAAALTPWQRRAQWLRNHPLVVILETAGLVGLIFAVGLFFYELRERQDERIARSWQLLTTPAPGNTGKRKALEYLNSQYGCLPATIGEEEKPWCWKTRTDLQGIDLSSKTHRGAVDLFRVDLRGAWLRGANLSGADFTNALLSNAIVHGTNLSRANLSAADLTEAELGRTQLYKADLSGADLSGSNLYGAELREALLINANLTRAGLVMADLYRADLTKGDFSGATLIATNLSRADLSGANLNGADLSVSNLTGANLDSTSWANAVTTYMWAFENAPPRNAPETVLKTLAFRKIDESWSDFVDRMMHERPEMDWTETHKLLFSDG